MPDTSVRMPEVTARRRWDGLGDHGFVYMDSFGDTGATHVPRHSRLLGSTGAWGDPRWETLDLDENFCIFAVGVGATNAVMTGLLARDLGRWQDVVVITPPREKLRRPEAQPTAAVLQIALDEVLNSLRAQAGLPVGDLASMLGVSRRQFYNWIGRENEPDTTQEQRIRRSAALIAGLHEHFGAARRVRAALLAATSHGSAFDALKAADLATAAAASAAVTTGEQPLPDLSAPSQRRPYDREQVLIELAHSRDVPKRGDG